MQEDVDYNPSYTLLTIVLGPGEQIKAEPGAMVAQSGVDIQTGMSGGFFKGIMKSMVGGESFFVNTFTGEGAGGWVSLAPGAPGDISGYDIAPGRSLFVQGGAFLGCSINVETNTKFQGMKGFFSGESAFFIQCSTQDGQPGRTWFTSFGAIKQIPIQAGQKVIVDTGHVVAFEDTVQYTINKVGGLKSALLGGEGLVMEFTGQGSVWIQTRNVESLANKLIPFMPTRSN